MQLKYGKPILNVMTEINLTCFNLQEYLKETHTKNKVEFN